MRPRSASVALLLGLACYSVGCSRQPTAGGTGSGSPPVALLSDNPADESVLFPQIGGVAGYAGSASCQECHPKQYDTWHRSYHRTMTQLPTPEAVQADFNRVVLTNGTARFILSRTNRQFWIHMESTVPATPDRPAPEPVDVPLGLVTGSHHMQVFWLANGMGNCQIGFPFTWLIPEHRWVPRNATFLRPPTVELRPETWNLVCARCHATATQPGLDRAVPAWHTQVEEPGIACEACHGPGQRHVALERQLKPHPGQAAPNPRTAALNGASGAGTSLEAPAHSPQPANLWIVHPEKISPVRASQICGFCHSMKWWDSKEGWPERGFSFHPGDDLDATTPVMRPTQLDQQPWLKSALDRNP
ncbi:MAG: hypothetical protein KGS61_11240, partial [Verrucomicrobia bacterium]|nr:hypothetical protein [Verrucomicrobiota bacterium]